MKKTIDYINDHIYETISLSNAAKHVQLSPKYLSSLFVNNMHIAFNDYVQKMKIETAKSMLLNTDDSLSDIKSELINPFFIKGSHDFHFWFNFYLLLNDEIEKRKLEK